MDTKTLAAMRARMDALPPDDEELTLAERAAIARGRRDAVVFTHNEVAAELGFEIKKLTVAQARLLRAQLAVGNKRAVQKVIGVIKRARGNIQAAAKALGIAERTLFLWRDSIPALTEAIPKVARGRIGRPPVAKVLSRVSGAESKRGR
jgi:Bacterial regulatory protein, Fis family